MAQEPGIDASPAPGENLTLGDAVGPLPRLDFVDLPPPAPPVPSTEQPPGLKQVSTAFPEPKLAPGSVKTPPVTNPAVTLPIHPPEPKAQEKAPETTAPPTRPAAGVPAFERPADLGGQILAALDKRKRYPSFARSRRL